MIGSITSPPAAAGPHGYGVCSKDECTSRAKTGGETEPDKSTPDAIEDQNLDEEEKQQVQELKKRDQEVRAHESAHMAAGADLVQGGASFTFERGPDGSMYAVGGEVKIDTSAERDPDATIRKMQKVKRAALAPAEPSGTDRAVAARAGQIEAQARMEKNEQNQDDTSENNLTEEGTFKTSSRHPYRADPVGRSIDLSA